MRPYSASKQARKWKEELDIAVDEISIRGDN